MLIGQLYSAGTVLIHDADVAWDIVAVNRPVSDLANTAWKVGTGIWQVADPTVVVALEGDRIRDRRPRRVEFRVVSPRKSYYPARLNVVIWDLGGPLLGLRVRRVCCFHGRGRLL